MQSNEAGSSNACELLGFKRAVSAITEGEGLKIRSLVTDRHLSITAYIRDDLKKQNQFCRDLKHYNDVWHTAKGNFNNVTVIKLDKIFILFSVGDLAILLNTNLTTHSHH